MTAAPNDGWLAAHPPPRRVRLFALPSAGNDYAVEDWLKLPETGERIELIDGSFIVSPMPAFPHALCAGRLRQILVEAAPEAFEVVATGNLEVGEDGLIPDVLVGRAEAMLTDVTMLAAADTACVVEVASRRRIDEVKPPKYAAAGIPVFIRVDLRGDDAPRVEVFNLSDQGYELVAEGKAGNVLSLDQPFPVSFDPAVLTGPRSMAQG